MFVGSQNGIYSVGVESTHGELQFGPPKLLFTGVREPARANVGSRSLAVSRDGSRIYWLQAIEQPGADVIHIRSWGLPLIGSDYNAERVLGHNTGSNPQRDSRPHTFFTGRRRSVHLYNARGQ
jgi:hypothetical protein